MMRAVTAEQMRAADAACVAAGTPVDVLMERAGAALAEELLSAFGKAAYAFFCGRGNNGGDGLICARRLMEQGCAVEVWLTDAPLNRDSCAAMGKLERAGAKIRPLYAFSATQADVLVDCLYGTGLSRALDTRDTALLGLLNAHRGHKVACDIPSGLHADSGSVLGAAFRADLTVTFQAYKYGQLFGDGVDLCGTIAVRDLGIALPQDASEIVDQSVLDGCFPRRRRNSNKGTFGRVTVVAGSDRYFGAALIAENACAALRMGCGYATLAVPASLMPVYQRRVVEATLMPLAEEGNLDFCREDLEKVCASDVVVFGMGLGVSPRVGQWVEALLREYRGKLLLDADGLNSLAAYGHVGLLEQAACTVCLTPHPKEFSRLSGLEVGEILSAPWQAARAFAREHKVTVLLKGTTTAITDGNRVLLNVTGSPALAKAGSGDVLSGAAGALLARVPAMQALAAAAYLHGRAGIRQAERLGEYSVLATDLCAALREIKEEFHEDCQ